MCLKVQLRQALDFHGYELMMSWNSEIIKILICMFFFFETCGINESFFNIQEDSINAIIGEAINLIIKEVGVFSVFLFGLPGWFSLDVH